MSQAPATRTEQDSMGEMPVPAEALYGASTQRAVLNFPISGYRFGRSFLRALGLVKAAAAQANLDLGKLPAEQADLILRAAAELIDGRLDAEFPIDIFQTGSGTSTNMNANEVLANRSSQLAGQPIGSRKPVHPNDHVNMGQSSNDVIPTAMHVAAAETLWNDLLPALQELAVVLRAKSQEFWEVIKIGRTHLDGRHARPARSGVCRLRAAGRTGGGSHPERGRQPQGTSAGRHGRGHRTELPPGIPGHCHPSSERADGHQFPRGK